MLNNEQLELLQWIQEQPNEVSMNTMEKLSAPNFTPARVEVLHKGNYIELNIGVENGEIVSVYSISDKGRAALQNQNSISREKHIENVKYVITTSIAVAALITAIVSIVLQYL